MQDTLYFQLLNYLFYWKFLDNATEGLRKSIKNQALQYEIFGGKLFKREKERYARRKVVRVKIC